MNPDPLVFTFVMLISNFNQKAFEAYGQQYQLYRYEEQFKEKVLGKELTLILGKSIVLSKSIIEQRILIQWNF